MNHRRMTLAIAAIVAAAALTTVAFAVPQHVMAYRHHHHHNNNHKSIKVDQQVNQENQCTGQSTDMQEWVLPTPQSGARCINDGSNDATVNH
jgi:curli biogenesis system outer membrane secretion channel CsgG